MKLTLTKINKKML